VGEVIDLKPASLVEDHSFVVDLARYRENLVDEKTIRKKYRLADDVWEALGNDDELIRKVEEESVRRVRSGQLKRERAQQLVVKAPDVLGGIMLDSAGANARHRIDAAKELNNLASNGPGAAVPAGAVFSIVINLGADENGKQIIERYDKPLKISPWDVAPNDDAGTAPEQFVITANNAGVTTNKTPEEIALDVMMARGD
jgi:hypothetical protein